MANQKEPFDREKLDEEIEKLSQIQDAELLMEIPEARLTDDLRRGHQGEAEADVQSLSHVYSRLQTHERYLRAISNRSGSIHPFPSPDLSRQEMRPMYSISGFGRGSNTRPRSRLTTIAAVLLAGLLLTSMFWASTWFRSHNVATNREGTPMSLATPGSREPLFQSLYVSNEGTLTKLDAKTGTTIWHVTIPSTSLSPTNGRPLIGRSVVSGNLVYVADQDGGAVYAFQIQNGRLAWSHEFGEVIYLNSLALADNLLSISTVSGDIYGLNSTNGSVLKHFRILGHPVYLALDQGILYASDDHSDLYAFKIGSGQLIWHQQISQYQKLNALQVSGGILSTSSSEIDQRRATPSASSYVSAFNAQTGTMIWHSQKMDGSVFDTNMQNGVIYCGTDKNAAYAYDVHSGRLLWSYRTNGPIFTPPLVEEGIILINHAKGQDGSFTTGGIIALNASNRSLRWENTSLLTGLDTFHDSHVLIAYNGVVYIGMVGKVTAVSIFTGKTIWMEKTGLIGSPLSPSLVLGA